MADATVVCPFCRYRNDIAYIVQLHIEERHTEDSTFVPRSENNHSNSSSYASSRDSSHSNHSSRPRDVWTRCHRDGCGEYVLISEIKAHLDVHTAIALSEQDEPLPWPNRTTAESKHVPKSRVLEKRKSHRPPSRTGDRAASVLSSVSGTSTQSRATVRQIRRPLDPGRLGKRELGPYAFEQRMPKEVRTHLLYAGEPTYTQCIGRDGRLVRRAHAENQTMGIVEILSELCSLDRHNVTTYLCHPATRHVRKLYCDGNFCGYWSIQMLLTYVHHVKPHGPQEIPNVIQMQHLIEQAWENGICAYSKVETGGIMNTRKWIGTQEAVAFFTRIGIKVEALCIGDGGEHTEYSAAEELLDHVEAYFLSGTDNAQRHGTSYITQLSPVYLQRLGHSMVIVGLERQRDGSRNLLVFDSSFETSETIRRLLHGRRLDRDLDRTLEPYRRSNTSLRSWKEFEIIIPRPREKSEAAV